MHHDKPLLSICIPTFNRAPLLRSALGTLMHQIQESHGEAELIISDNASSDNTADVVRWAETQGPLRYNRNASNLGPCYNIRLLTNDLAQGDYCWVLGDDELLRDGAVRAILDIIKKNRDVGFIYVNYSIDDFSRREDKQVSAADFNEWTLTGNKNQEYRRVEKWEELLAEDMNCLTPIYSGIFRREGWTSVFAELAFDFKPFRNVENTYPHTYTHAKIFAGKPAISTGYPWVIMCGKESWAEHVPVVVLLRFHELLDHLERTGVSPVYLEAHRRTMLRHATGPLAKIIQGSRAAGLEAFSFTAFITKYYRYPEMWRSLRDAILLADRPSDKVPSPVLSMSALALRKLSGVVKSFKQRIHPIL